MKIAELIKYEGDNSTFIWKHPLEIVSSILCKRFKFSCSVSAIIKLLFVDYWVVGFPHRTSARFPLRKL